MLLGRGRLDYMLVAFAIFFICYILAKVVVLTMGLTYCNFVVLQEGLLDITLKISPLKHSKCLNINAIHCEHHIFKGQ